MERVPESEAIAEMADARHFNEFMGSNRFRQEEYRQLARQVAELGVPPGGKVLDVGTGPGFVAIEVARLLRGTSGTVVGLDLSKAMLTLAAENAHKVGLDDRLIWRDGDARQMPFADREFDLVITNDSLHHWEDPLLVLNEIARVLKDNGQCIIHDSKRLQHWAPKLFAGVIGLMIPPDFRVHYWGSIRSSYTADELRSILAHSRLKGAQVEEDWMNVMIVKRQVEKPTGNAK
jgi:ubiquinone/menaquinone biosynthesis C-methylase UbiE